MDLKSYINIEIEKNGRSYTFQMPIGAPYGECYDASFEVMVKITELMNEAFNKVAEAKKGETIPQGE